MVGVRALKLRREKSRSPDASKCFARIDNRGHFSTDLIALLDEGAASVTREFKPAASKITPMLETVFENRNHTAARPTLMQSREHFLAQFAMLGERQRALNNPPQYPVRLTAALNAMMISERLRAEGLQD